MPLSELPAKYQTFDWHSQSYEMTMQNFTGYMDDYMYGIKIHCTKGLTSPILGITGKIQKTVTFDSLQLDWIDVFKNDKKGVYSLGFMKEFGSFY
jgi:hypothetical protein